MRRKLTNYKLFLTILIVLLSSCSSLASPTEMPFSEMSTDQLILILKDPNSERFMDAVNEGLRRTNDYRIIAPTLAQSLQLPRRDSYIAGIALISMREKALYAIPYLEAAIINDNSTVRAYALLALGTIGKSSGCSMPQIAKLLYDKDPIVRAAAANAMELISVMDLVNASFKFDPAFPNILPEDTPDNLAIKQAIEWWSDEGEFMEWSGSSDLCHNQ